MEAKRVLDRASTKQLFRFMLDNRMTRKALFGTIRGRMFKELVETNADHRPRRVQEGKHAYMMALLHGFDRAASRGYISRNVTRKLIDVFLENIAISDEAQREIEARIGFRPPLFVVVSPTGRCNLRCTGCYAASDASCKGSLDFQTFDRILTEKRENWDSHFTVISGGEPLLWKDSGVDILDMAEKHNNDLFMMYTNGTLIDDDKAERMAALGNITPAISVEGFQDETDARRGKGVHRKILAAFERLRRHGVAFGISVTPTVKNWDVVTSDDFIDFYFNRQGAVYGWSFQYMPVGRGPALEMMVSPEDRLEMMRRTQKIVRDQKVFYADFWNSGIASSGCISAGRPGGYFYIDWNGDIMPCVFVPYAADNIYDVYKRGECLNDVLRAPFFRRIRKWQDEYGYAQPADKVDNWLCPCAIRDHFDMLHEAAVTTKARPINDEAAAALRDRDFYEGLVRYDRDIERLTRPVWESQYAEPSTTPAAPEEDALVRGKERNVYAVRS